MKSQFKKILALVACLCLVLPMSVYFATATDANFADFDTIVPKTANGDSSYSGSYTTTNGWVTENSAIQCGGSKDSNPQFTVIGPDNSSKAVCMNGKVSAPGKITSPTLTGGISKLTINYTKMFTDTNLGADITITDLATGAVYTNKLAKEADKNTKYEVWTYEWVLETPIAGDFKIEILNNSPTQQTGNKDRLTILDVSWEAGATSAEPEAPVFNENPYDQLDTYDKVAEYAGLEKFVPHPEMGGKSVIMRAPATLADGESYVIYKNEGNVATAISVSAVVMDGWGFDLAVSGRAADGEWTALDYVTSAIVEIPGASNPAFKQAVATVTVPENIAEVKVALVNTGAAWTFAIDYVDITWAPVAPADVVVSDPLDTYDNVIEHVGLEKFVPHPEMGGKSVIMRAPATLADGESYVIYKNDGEAKAISVSAVVMDGWGFDLAVSGRAAGGEWIALEYTNTAPAEIPGASNPAFKQAVATVTVPAGINEVKVALVNTGAAWTFAIDSVDITWGAASATPDEPETPDTPDTPDVPTDSKYKEGVAYKLGLDQTAKGETYYFTGVMSGFYGATDTDVSKAVDMFVEIVDGGYKLFFNGESGKQYIALVQSGTHYNFTFGAEGSVFSLDAEKDAFHAMAGDTDCYMGTYGSYVTIGTLKAVKDSDYIARLYTVGGETPDTPDTPDNPDTPDTPVEPDKPEVEDPAADSTLSVKDAIDLGLSKEHNVFTDNKYYVTGEITEIYNDVYGNMRITDADGNILTIYGTYDADGTNRFDAMTTQPVVGDTVKLYGIIGQYNGTPQMKNGWILAINPTDEPVTPDEPSEPDTPVTPDEPETPDVPGESKPQGENTTGVVIALVLMALAAAAVVITAKKRA